MKFGVGVDYCLKALLMLAERYPSNRPWRVDEIAAARNIPENYLRRLLVELKRGGLVSSQKGPSGGYLLARPPSRITMADVVHIIEGDFAPVECLESGMAGGLCRPGDGCPMRQAWTEIREAVNAILTRTTLQTLAERRGTALEYQI